MRSVCAHIDYTRTQQSIHVAVGMIFKKMSAVNIGGFTSCYQQIDGMHTVTQWLFCGHLSRLFVSWNEMRKIAVIAEKMADNVLQQYNVHASTNVSTRLERKRRISIAETINAKIDNYHFHID